MEFTKRLQSQASYKESFLLKCLELARWVEIGQNGSKWVKMGRNRSKWVKMATDFDSVSGPPQAHLTLRLAGSHPVTGLFVGPGSAGRKVSSLTMNC
jgi:hypothetical protein